MSRFPTRSQVATIVPWVLVPVLFLVTFAVWALSSPVGSSPDEDFHLTSIWCAQGDRTDACDVSDDGREALAPSGVVDSARCFAFDGTESAACQSGYVGDFGELVPTERGNFTDIYPPVFYAVLSPLVGPDIGTSVMIMRMVNAVTFVGLAGLLTALLPGGRRRTLLLAALVGLVPLGISLIASVNPSSWSLLAPAGVFLALLGAFETTGRRRIGLYAMSIVFALMGAGARADTAAYVALAAVCAVVIAVGRGQMWRRAVGAVPVLLIAAAFFLTSRQSPLSLAAGSGDAGLHLASGPVLPLAAADGDATVVSFWSHFLAVPEWWQGAFGTWALGWFDTTLPGLVPFFSLAAYAAVTFEGLRRPAFGKIVALVAVVAALWLFPVVISLGSSTVLPGIQPRYLLPLIWLLAAVALVGAPYGRVQFSRLQLAVAAIGLSLAHTMALHAQMRRYVTGQDVVSLNLNAQAEWWWHIPVSPMVIWFLGSAAFLAASLLVAWLVTTPARGLRTARAQSTRRQLGQGERVAA
jgi:hypothetical protein